MKRFLSLFFSLVIVATMFTGCTTATKEFESTTSKVDTSGFSMSYSENEDDVDLHTAKQQSYIDGNYLKIKDFCKGKESYDKTNSIEYSYDKDFVLSVSENEDMSSPWLISSKSNVAKVDNLKINTTYYVTARVDGQTIKLDSFTTADCAPRIINVDGVKNVRDIGGWKTTDNHYVKQGLIYRCGRLNESDADEATIEITKSGINTMVNDLGVKTEIDFRRVDNNEIGSITSSALGDTVNYINCPMTYNGDIFYDNQDEIVKVFHILSDKNNYPIIYHCNIGTDRTGMITYLLNALLGVDDEDLTRDYLFSNFADIGGSRSAKRLRKQPYYKALEKEEGDTLSEKTFNLLLDIGVPKEELNNIIAIMKE